VRPAVVALALFAAALTLTALALEQRAAEEITSVGLL
jgi:hypothetical protein